MDGPAAAPSPVLFGSPGVWRCGSGRGAPPAAGGRPQFSRPWRLRHRGRPQGKVGPGLPFRRDDEPDRGRLRVSCRPRYRYGLRLPFGTGAPRGTHALGRRTSGLRDVSGPGYPRGVVIHERAAQTPTPRRKWPPMPWQPATRNSPRTMPAHSARCSTGSLPEKSRWHSIVPPARTGPASARPCC